MKNTTLLHEVSPEKFKADILAGVRKIILEHLKKNNSPERLLNRKEVAKVLSISLPTLRGYVKRGLLVEHRIGSRVLYKWSDIINSFPNKGLDK